MPISKVFVPHQAKPAPLLIEYCAAKGYKFALCPTITSLIPHLFSSIAEK